MSRWAALLSLSLVACNDGVVTALLGQPGDAAGAADLAAVPEPDLAPPDDLAAPDLNPGCSGPLLVQRRPVVTLPGWTGAGGIVAADLDGDGHLDVAVDGTLQSAGLQVVYGAGDGSLGDASFLDAGVASRYVTLGDFNGDRRPDLAVATGIDVAVFLNRGGRKFSPAAHYPAVGGLTQSLIALDLDEDGHLDLLAGTITLEFFRGMGDGTFAKAVVGSKAVLATLFAADVDEDGHLDVIGQPDGSDPFPQGGGLRVLFGDGRASFPRRVDVVAVNAGRIVGPGVATDLDGNKHLDLAFGTQGNTLVVAPGNGKGAFGRPHEVPLQGGVERGMAAGDLDGRDGNDLLVSLDVQGSIPVFLNGCR